MKTSHIVIGAAAAYAAYYAYQQLKAGKQPTASGLADAFTSDVRSLVGGAAGSTSSGAKPTGAAPVGAAPSPGSGGGIVPPDVPVSMPYVFPVDVRPGAYAASIKAGGTSGGACCSSCAGGGGCAGASSPAGRYMATMLRSAR